MDSFLTRRAFIAESCLCLRFVDMVRILSTIQVITLTKPTQSP
jgi:hypothetical protein